MYGALAFGLTLAIGYGYKTMRVHPAFAVETLEIKGASSKIEGELRELLDDVRGANIFRLDLAELRDRVRGHAWVDNAVVQSLLPDRVKILVIERIPAGLARRGNAVDVVSSDGETICSYQEYGQPLDMPVIIGSDRAEDPREALMKGLRTLEAIKRASLLFWDNLETLDVADGENMKAKLRNASAPLYLGAALIPANVKNYLLIADRVERDHPALEYIELGFPNQIAVMPKKAEE